MSQRFTTGAIAMSVAVLMTILYWAGSCRAQRACAVQAREIEKLSAEAELLRARLAELNGELRPGVRTPVMGSAVLARE